MRKKMKDKAITFKLSGTEKSMIEDKAEKAGLDVTKFILWKTLPEVYSYQVKAMQKEK